MPSGMPQLLMILSAIIFGGVIAGVIDSCNAEPSSRRIHQCEIVGEVHNCIRYSARVVDSSHCSCIVPSRARLEYYNSWEAGR